MDTKTLVLVLELEIWTDDDADGGQRRLQVLYYYDCSEAGSWKVESRWAGVERNQSIHEGSAMLRHPVTCSCST